MSLIEEIEEDVKEATLARDAQRRDALRLILSSLRSAEKDLQRPLSEDEELQVLQRERKRRIEAAEAFREAGREEQAAKEEGELEILEEFMPAPLSEEELERIVDDAIAENKATSMRDMGRVMADVMPQIAGRADGSAVGQLVREKLANDVAEVSFERLARSFGPAAELYDRARPSYPDDAIRWMLGETPLRVVDLGAGTGIFSRAVAAFGHDVTAVDHDPGMLERLAVTSPEITPVEGSAEAIPLPDGSADAVVAAQAFHWFDNDVARAEIARVLRPGGVFAPIWNIRDESVDWVAALTAIIPAGARASASRHVRRGRDFGPLYAASERAEFHHAVLHTTESLVRLVQSRSMYLVADDGRRRQVEDDVRRLVADLPQPFELPYLTVAFRAHS